MLLEAIRRLYAYNIEMTERLVTIATGISRDIHLGANAFGLPSANVIHLDGARIEGGPAL
jgi:hypothetical protein